MKFLCGIDSNNPLCEKSTMKTAYPELILALMVLSVTSRSTYKHHQRELQG